MKSLVDWHVLYDSLLEVTDEIDIDVNGCTFSISCPKADRVL